VIYEIKFTPEAEKTYESVVSQLFERWGEKFVFKFESRLEKVLDTLTHSPFIYPVVVESTQIRKSILHKNCSLLYKVTDQSIVIICFWDNRQDPIFT